MKDAIVQICGAMLLAFSLLGGGYWWGDDAATNRDKAIALTAERTAATALAEANDRLRSAEHQAAQAMAEASANYQKELSDVATRQKNTVARIRADALRLSIPARTDPADATAAIATPASGRDGAPRCRLSDTAAEFLTGLASEADGIVQQLSACQVLLGADRALLKQEGKGADQ